MGLIAPTIADDDPYAEPSPAWVAEHFGVTVEEAEWVLVVYRFQLRYPEGPVPGRFYCEAL